MLKIRIFLNRPNSMKISKSCFKLDHFSTNLGKIFRPNEDLNWPNSILTAWAGFYPLISHTVMVQYNTIPDATLFSWTPNNFQKISKGVGRHTKFIYFRPVRVKLQLNILDLYKYGLVLTKTFRLVESIRCGKRSRDQRLLTLANA